MDQQKHIPENFIYLTDVVPGIIEKPRYFGCDNFLGRPVPGYISPRIVCTREAAQALKRVEAEVRNQGYKLVVYDGYRPQRAVDTFFRWSKDCEDQLMKEHYYPYVNKEEIFCLGYVMSRSSHSRGSTFDLTLIADGEQLQEIKVSQRRLANGEMIPYLCDHTVDMGSSFDLFHEASHHGSPLITEEQTHMREPLQRTMKKHGFKDYEQEWWHYTLIDEPYPDRYFDFVK